MNSEEINEPDPLLRDAIEYVIENRECQYQVCRGNSA